MDRNRNLYRIFLTFAMILWLTCCNLPGKSQVNVTIESHEDRQSVELNKSIHVISYANAAKGVEAIELYANDVLVQTSRPVNGSPNEYAADQTWVPQQEGQVVISVIARDVEGNISEPFSIILNVVPAVSDMETTPTLTPTNTLTPDEPTQTQPTQEDCTNNAAFMEDVTIPPNTYLLTGSNFTKTWRILNNGSCDWVGYELVHISGSLFGAQSPQALAMVNAGHTVDVSVEMTTPTSPGTYSAIWRMRDSEGNLFGPELTLTIIVSHPDTQTPTPTHTLTITPTLTRTLTPTPTLTPTLPELSVEQVYEQVSISAGSTGTTTATCPAGSVVVSGGFASDPQLLIYTHSKNGNGWRVYAKNNASSTKTLTVFATCLVNSGGSTSQQGDQVTAAAGSIAHVEVNCPSGSLITGGGWASNTSGDIWVYNSSKNDNGWQIYVRNSGSNSHLVSAYAMCLSGVSGSTQDVLESVSISSGGTGYALATCSSGDFVVGGGFACQDDLDVYNSSDRSLTDNGWIVYAFNTGGSSRTMYGYAICYSP